MPLGGKRGGELVAEAEQDLKLDIPVLAPASRLYAIACAIERRLCEATATRTRGRASRRRRVSVSKFPSHSALSVKTGTDQPRWAASADSWSQYAPFTSRTTGGWRRSLASAHARICPSSSGESRR